MKLELVRLCKGRDPRERDDRAREHTGDARYAWMNRIQAVAKDSWDGAAMVVTYPAIYELR